jgi:sulfite exporter TauE/SafE
MWGGINISQCHRYGKEKAFKPSLLYNLGRVASYTLIGGLIGGIGSVLNFSGQLRGYVTIFVSVIMVLFALRTLKLFHFKTRIIRFPKILLKLQSKLSNRGPFFVGLANGLMPCGPLQSMQLYALGSGSILVGSLSMFYFSLGTFPLMFGLGFVSTLLNHRFSKNIMKYTGFLIFILGISMFSRGASLAGIIIPIQHDGQIASAHATESGQEVIINLASNQYTPIRVKNNIPVTLIILADSNSINGCNNPISIPSLDIVHTLIPGENYITFTPTKEGKLIYTCWMGMITSYIEVIDD